MNLTSKENVDKVMRGLPPQARTALEYIAGRLPSIDIEGAIRVVKDRAYQAGYIVGSLRKIASRWGRE